MGNVEQQFRHRPLCACVSAAFVLVAPGPGLASAVSASALSFAAARVHSGVTSALLSSVVTDCSDSPGNGTLRHLVLYASSGETIYAGGCATITLADVILVPDVAMTVAGPSRIYAPFSRPAFASASPELTFSNVTIFGGLAPSYLGGKGGAIYAIGEVSLQDSKVFGGVAGGSNGKGGAIYTSGSVTLQNSTIEGGVAQGTAGKGGAIYAGVHVTLLNSIISGGIASGSGGKGGSIFAPSVSLKDSGVYGGQAAAGGGCISAFSVFMDHGTVKDCASDAYSFDHVTVIPEGGAIAATSVTLGNASRVSNSFTRGSRKCTYDYYGVCQPYTASSNSSSGGGIRTTYLACYDSRIDHNLAKQDYYDSSTGGGLTANTLALTRCTIDSNATGGIFLPSGSAEIVDSTISGNNYAPAISGSGNVTLSLTRSTVSGNGSVGIVLPAGSAEIVASTISGNLDGIIGTGNVTLTASTVAFNGYFAPAGSAGIVASRISWNAVGTAVAGNHMPAAGQGPASAYDSGIALGPGSSLSANSSIIAQNGYFGGFGNYRSDLVLNGPLTGADNLIMTADLSQPAPPGAITITADPKLLPLADNGGPTQTHALQIDSPALNKGNNAGKLATDQRGDGFLRAFGRPDIGAYEWQVAGDEIFYDGFD